MESFIQLGNNRIFWFYVRKFIFQVFLPIVLGFMSFCDFVNQSGNKNSYAYEHLYFYTSFFLFSYTAMKYFFDFIFNTCSDDILLMKEIKTGENKLLTTLENKIGNDSENFIVITKKIYKLRYSNFSFFLKIKKLCWFLGIDSPILIPYDIVKKLTNMEQKLSLDNENVYLYNTISNLYMYHPRKNMINVDDNDNNNDNGNANDIEKQLKENLIPKIIITKMDKSISDLQQELFNKESILDDANV